MPEFLTLLPPDDARIKFLAGVSARPAAAEAVDFRSALGRVLAADIIAPIALPEFPRSSVDGYAVRAADTFGASESVPAYLTLVGEVPMGRRPSFGLADGECALIHTGGMLPEGATAALMLEHSEAVNVTGGPKEDGPVPSRAQVEVRRAVADGENAIAVGEDIRQGETVIAKGAVLGPAEIGALAAIGVLSVPVAMPPVIGLISTGDEVIEPSQIPASGQVRDVNTYSLCALVRRAGGIPKSYGIIRDQLSALKTAATTALAQCDALLLTAGSSASARDLTAEVVNALGHPGVVVHGLSTRPGKPTILGICDGKAVIGLPGNPVSALVNGYLFVVPLIRQLLGALALPRPAIRARLTVNLPSAAGREDWWPVRLLAASASSSPPRRESDVELLAEPVFGKSNLIFGLVRADGLLRIEPDATGLPAGELVDVFPL